MYYITIIKVSIFYFKINNFNYLFLFLVNFIIFIINHQN